MVEAAVAVETPVPVTSADLPWLDDGAVQSAPPAGALEGALFLGQVPTHSCPHTCASVDCASFCASQGGAGVCWNGCWNLTLRSGPNRASFAAGRQTFKATVPKAPTFILARGTAYLFEVWDSEGRVQRHGFTL